MQNNKERKKGREGRGGKNSNSFGAGMKGKRNSGYDVEKSPNRAHRERHKLKEKGCGGRKI